MQDSTYSTQEIEPQTRESVFVPEYHETYGSARYYALPGYRGGVSRITNPLLGTRCWTVWRNALALNLYGPYDTYEEADGQAALLALEEEMRCARAVQAGRPAITGIMFIDAPGIVSGSLKEGEGYE